MSTKSDSYILFEVDGTTYALLAGYVQHVEMLEHVTPVPNSPACVDGVVFSRGQVVPALNLRALFGLARQERTARTRLIVLRFQERQVGLVVDQAREFRVIPEQVIKPVGLGVARLSGSYLEATAVLNGRLVLLPSLQAILEAARVGAILAPNGKALVESSIASNLHSS